jgi:hypothetical protein
MDFISRRNFSATHFLASRFLPMNFLHLQMS